MRDRDEGDGFRQPEGFGPSEGFGRPALFRDDDIPTVTDAMVEHRRVDFEEGLRLLAPATILLMLACLCVFVHEVQTGAVDELHRPPAAVGPRGEKEKPQLILALGANDRDRVLKHGEWWRLLTSVFLHASVAHLIGNLALWVVVGLGCEHAFGSAGALAVFAAAGIGGSLAGLTHGHVSVGASGAVFGLCGALVAVFARHHRRFALRNQELGWTILLLSLYLMVLGALKPGVDNHAHLGGFAAGFGVGLLLPLVRPKVPAAEEGVAS